MYIVRAAGPGKGLGVFATQQIPRGTRILSERAVLSIWPPSSSPAPSSAPSHTPTPGTADTTRSASRKSTAQQLLDAFQNLKAKDKEAVLALSGYPGTGITLLGRWASALVFSLSSPARFRQAIARSKAVLDIFRSNSFLLCPPTFPRGSKDEGARGGRAEDPAAQTLSLFPKIARINHVCIPNAQANLHPLTSCLNVHALRDIPPGEEICISYLGETGLLGKEERNKTLAGWGFVCACPACSGAAKKPGAAGEKSSAGKELEKRRVALRQRIQAFALLKAGDTSRAQHEDEGQVGGYAPDGSTDAWDPAPIPSSLAQNVAREGDRGSETGSVESEISLTTDLIAHLRDAGISGHELASLHYRLAHLYLAEPDVEAGTGDARPGVSRREKALDSARMGVAIDGSCLGHDHPVYLEALSWVRGLEKEVEGESRSWMEDKACKVNAAASVA